MSEGAELGFDELSVLWDAGARALAAADPGLIGALTSVRDAIMAELRRRLGGSFTTQELARCYLQGGTDWCFDVATRTAPTTPEAWDMQIVVGAAFARLAHFASDFGGGRRTVEES
jgi:hypothetical protein